MDVRGQAGSLGQLDRGHRHAPVALLGAQQQRLQLAGELVPRALTRPQEVRLPARGNRVVGGVLAGVFAYSASGRYFIWKRLGQAELLNGGGPFGPCGERRRWVRLAREVEEAVPATGDDRADEGGSCPRSW